MLVIETSVDLDLASEFLAGFSPRKIGLGDNLEGPGHALLFFSLNRFNSADLVALGKSSLSEEATALVSDSLARFIVVLRVDWLHFLFNDLYKHTTSK
jgi:hypothetical protein